MGKKKFANQVDLKVAVIGDEDTVAGFCLAGVGQRDANGVTNFLVVDSNSKLSDIEEAFRSFTLRKDMGVIVLNQHVAEDIRPALKEYAETGQIIPTVLEIPSKDHPYDPKKDALMQRVQVFFGANAS
jgi:V-type H+-transporting ATPase subunit F